MKKRTYTYRLASLALIAALLIGNTTGCSQSISPNSNQSNDPNSLRGNDPDDLLNKFLSGHAADEAANHSDPTLSGTDTTGIYLSPVFATVEKPYVSMEVTPNVADYSINPDLSNIVNLDQFPNLTAEQKQKIASNGFVVAPGKKEQLFYIYEENTYKKVPNFVTTDSVLQVYHIFFDYTLRTTENEKLFPNALTLNNNLLAQLQKEYDSISDPTVKACARKALGYFSVAQLAFGGELPGNLPTEVKTLVEKEIQLVNSASGSSSSPLLGCDIDYSLMTPRGHYTRSEDLKTFFRGMSWYGAVPFYLYDSDGTTQDTESTMCAIIMTAMLYRLPEEEGSTLWENIYSTTEFFVGAADDITPFQYAEILKKIYGDELDLNELSDPVKLDLFYKEADKLSKPQITLDDTDSLSSLQFRFMGQRYIPDSEILQELSSPSRLFPSGLDIFASLGSKRAADLIASIYDPVSVWPDYTEKFEQMKRKFTTLPVSTWQSNMYYGWLWTQNSLTGEYGKGYPMFMRNTAWQDKSLATALGSWAEMRHDTILYAKGSTSECGGFDEPPVVRAYVEPNYELYNRLLWLTSYSRENLAARDVLPENIEYVCERFENMLTFLRDCSLKELRGEDLTAEEYDSLLTYGGLLESLTTSCVENGSSWYQIQSETDRNMALIADVHSAPGGYLEEAVGTAAEIYVAVPMNGELYLTRGAVFDYFEFVSNKRMTDEEWQTILQEAAPERPPFTSSFMEGEAPEVPTPIVPYSTGC